MNILQMFGAAMGGAIGTQFLRPIDDYNPGFSDWIPYGDTELWLCTDDVEPDEDATYAATPQDEIGKLMILQLSPGVGTVQESKLHKVVVRMRFQGNPNSVPFFDMLFYGGPGQTNLILIESVNFLSGSWVDYEWELSPTDIAKIVNYDEMLIAITPYWIVGPGPTDVRCTQMYFQIGGE